MMLSIKELDSGYGSTQILRQIHLDVSEGEVVSVIGANGAGKSTLLRTISLVGVAGPQVRCKNRSGRRRLHNGFAREQEIWPR